MTKPKTAQRAKPATKSTAPKANPPAKAPAAASRSKSKIAILVDLLSRAQGMSIAQAAEATGWQAHSVRGALAGSIKKRLGHTVISEKVDGGRIYRIAPKSA